MTLPATIPPARFCAYRSIVHPRDRSLLDQALVVYFASPQSFTGEDVVELHIHGGNAVKKAILKELGTLEGFRVAEAGEFTKRYFSVLVVMYKEREELKVELLWTMTTIGLLRITRWI
jgi:tRNA modification GTPase